MRDSISDALKCKRKDPDMGDLRQFYGEMVRKCARKMVGGVSDIVSEYEDVGHSQAGHNTNMADKNYGRTKAEFLGLGRRVVDKYRNFARIWHKMIFPDLSTVMYKKGNTSSLKASLEMDNQTFDISADGKKSLSVYINSKLQTIETSIKKDK